MNDFMDGRRRRLLLLGLCAISIAVVAGSITVGPSACSSPPSNNIADDGGSGVSEAAATPKPTPPSDAGDGNADGGSKPSLAAIYADKTLWKALPPPTAGTCTLLEGRVVPDPFPHRVWSSCAGIASGCKETPTALPVDELQYSDFGTAAGAYMNGDFYVLLDQYTYNTALSLVTRISDGASVAAVLNPKRGSSCILTAGGGAAPLLFAFFQNGVGTRFGRASITPSTPIAWHPSWVDMPPMRDHFMSDDLYGAAVLGNLLYLTPTATDPIPLDGSGQTAQGLGNQVLWTGVSSKAIHSFTLAGGPVDLIPIAAPRDPIGTRMSNDKIVWGEGILQGEIHSDVHFHWSPRTTNASEIVAHDSPLTPIFGCMNDVHVQGDWVATTGCVKTGVPNDPDPYQIFLWHLSTNEILQLPHRAGRHFLRILGLSPTEVLLADVQKDPSFRGTITGLVRIELAALPSVIAAWK